ncbi:MAG: polyprenyl synthetase family protein [Bacteroidales bacterium]|nr:polyprenyl synthetase family protein [Bacteroidales bacterium]
MPANLYEPVRYTLDLEAKRIRPALVLMSCELFSDDVKQAIAPALAIEIFHNFTLMHDDIMDQSSLRRNQPTVHAKWNVNIALLSGDAMLIKAYELLSQLSGNRLTQIMPVFNLTALQVCEGQQLDMDYENRDHVSIDEYLKMVEYKTAVLVAASLKMGALLGGAGEKDAGLLYDFGRDLGIAFQLQDDLLDTFADQAVFGKVTGNDIVANKKTILLCEALRLANPKQQEKLKGWLNRKSFDRDEKIKAIKDFYVDLQVEKYVRERIESYHQNAMKSLQQLGVDESKKSALLDFADYLMHRKK